MSSLSKCHYGIARSVRWHSDQWACAYPDLDYDVSAPVEHYHRQDRYREVWVRARKRRFLVDVLKSVSETFDRYRNVRISTEITQSARSEKEHFLIISIWPERKVDSVD